ncbi:MAG: hypothetical protein K0Q55_24 [Verrucomicrobia bacterium]|jgi:hypothetical protein|nr:hypothetical protein [Verrucomicrobiota bacterium]
MWFIRYHGFDIVILILIISGLLYGRKRGLSVELLPLAHWLTLVIVCGTFSEPIGAPIAALIEIQPNAAFVFVYLILAGAVTYGFWTLSRTVAKGLPGSKCFGEAEFPLGAVAAAIRFVTILFVGMALTSAQYIPEEDLAEPRFAFQTEENSFPDPAELHRGVFVRSWGGRWLKHNFGHWLIAAQPPVKYDSVIVDGYHKGMQRAVEGEPSR